MEKILVRTGIGEFLEIVLPPDANFGSVREAAEKAAGLFPPEYRENLPLMSGADLRKLGEALWKIRNAGTAPEPEPPDDLSSSFPVENPEDTEEKRNPAVLPEKEKIPLNHIPHAVCTSDGEFFPDAEENTLPKKSGPHEKTSELRESNTEEHSPRKFFLPVWKFFRRKKTGVEIPQEREKFYPEHPLSDIELAYHFKWTLEYVRSLSAQDRKNCLAFLHGGKNSVSPAPAPVLPVSPELLKETTERAFAALKRFYSSDQSKSQPKGGLG